MPAPPPVSVIVPAYNEADSIGDCLEALLDQTYPRDRYEVIVVDNGSDDGTRDVVRAHPVTLVTAPATSQFGARNAGIERATGQVLAFTDADVTVAADWLVAGVRALETADGPTAVYGRVIPMLSDDPTVYERYDAIRSFRGADRQTWNLFTTAAVFERVGRFRERFLSGGDLEWADRAAREGVAIRHADDVRARHPPRVSWRSLWGMHVRRGYGGGQRLRFEHDQRRSLLVAKEPLRLADWYLTVARDLAVGSPCVDPTPLERVVFALLAVPLGLGMAAGRLRGLLDGSRDAAVGDYA